MDKDVLLAVGLVLGTSFLLVAALALNDFIAAWIADIQIYKDNPLFGRLVYVVIVSLIAIGVLLVFKPFGGAGGGGATTPPGVERGVADIAAIRGEAIPAILPVK